MSMYTKVKDLFSPKKIIKNPVDDEGFVSFAYDMFNAFTGYATQLGLANYEDMELKNAELSSALRTRRVQLMTYGWRVDPASAEEGDKEVAEFVTNIFNNLENQTFESRVQWLTYAMRDEFAILEIVPAQIENGPYAGKMGLKRLKPIDRQSVVPVSENKLLKEFKIKGNSYPAEQFVVYNHEPTARKWLGTSLFAVLIWYTWFLKNGLKWWGVYLDRYGMPIPIIKEPAGIGSELRTKIRNIVRDLQAGYAISVPENVVIETIEGAFKTGKTGYENYIHYCEEKITKLVLGQTLSTMEGQNSNRSQSEVHMKILEEYRRNDARELSGVINRQLIPKLVEWNFAGRDIPKLKIITEPPKQTDKEAARATAALEAGLALKEEEAYEAFNFKVPQEGDKVITPAPKMNPFIPPNPGPEDRENEDREQRRNKKKDKEDSKFGEVKFDPYEIEIEGIKYVQMPYFPNLDEQTCYAYTEIGKMYKTINVGKREYIEKEFVTFINKREIMEAMFAENQLKPDTERRQNRFPKDMDPLIAKYQQQYSEASQKLPATILTVLDRVSRGLPASPPDEEKKKSLTS